MWTCPNCSARNWNADTICHKCETFLVLDRADASERLKTSSGREPAVPSYPPLTSGKQIAVFERLKSRFEGKEALLYEKGLLRVRVSDILLRRMMISLTVEEIPTLGLGVGGFERGPRWPAGPLLFRLDAGFQSSFSTTSWSMGYGGGSLLFKPRTIESVVERAAMVEETDYGKRYHEVCRGLQSPEPDERREPVFPDEEEERGLIMNAEPAPVRMTGHWVHCPRCGMAFKPNLSSVWDGFRHLRCGQSLIIK